MNKTIREELVSSISEMESVYHEKSTDKAIKKLLLPSINRAKEQLQDLDKVEAALHASQQAETNATSPAVKAVKKIAKVAAQKKVHTVHAQVKKSITKLQKLVKKNPSLKEKYADTPAGSLEKDAQRRAKFPGKRKSGTGNTYFESRPNRSDVLGNKKYPMLEKGGSLIEKYKNGGKLRQNPPQGNSYHQSDDQKVPAKKPGWRYTDAGAKKLGVDPSKVPTLEHIAAYQGTYFRDNNHKSHRYLYNERRIDKSDLKKSFPYLEEGGELQGPGVHLNTGRMVSTLEKYNKLGEGGKITYKSQLGYDVKYVINGKVNRNKIKAAKNEDHARQLIADWKGIPAKDVEIEDVFIFELPIKHNKKKIKKELGGLLDNSLGSATYDPRFDIQSISFERGGAIPSYFGAGENLEVFGYHTANFDICGLATEQFRRAIEVIGLENEPGEALHRSMSQALADCAKKLDEIFGDEKKIYEDDFLPNEELIYTTVAASNLAAIYNYKSGLLIDLNAILPDHINNVIRANVEGSDVGSFVDAEIEDVTDADDSTIEFGRGGEIGSNTITKVSTGISNNQKLSDLKKAIINSIHAFVVKYCNNVTSEWNVEINKQMQNNICPLQAESWEYNQKTGYRIIVFTERFSNAFKNLITTNLKDKWADIIDIEKEQITAGTEYDL